MPKLADFQLILFDVDGTLTNSTRQITPRLQAALQKINEQHIATGVCTGRALVSIKKQVLPFFSPDALHVTCGGGQVISTQGQIHWQKVIAHATALDIVQHAQQFGAGFLLTQNNQIYVNEPMHEYLALRQDLHQIEIHSYTELTDYSTPIIPIFGAPIEFYNYLNELNDINYKQMQTYEHRNADITAKGVNKATGLFELSQKLHIPLEEIIGVGDSENDDEFLNAVGFSVAMGNATDYLKSIANHTIGSTNEDGLAIYLEQLAQGADL